jgi:poxvirus D5 protein-like
MKSYNASASEKDFNEVLVEIRGRVPLLTPSEDENVVALANGLFGLQTKELRSFTPEVVLTSKAAVRWNPHATTSPVIDGWDVDQWIKSPAVKTIWEPDMDLDTVVDPEVEQLLWEVVAALFRPNHSFDKAVLLVSESGSNGKGTFLELLRNLVGAKRVASVPMEKFGADFLPEKLISSFCVLSDENDVGAFMRSMSNFKAWVTHDWILLNRKGKDFLDVKGRCLRVFCLNELPKGQDKTESLYRRFIAVPFKGKFIDGHTKNLRIKSDYIHREDVLEYVAYRAPMMPVFDSFTVPQESEKLLDAIRVENDPITQFSERFLPELRWDLVPWDFVYALYRAWLKQDVPMGKPVNKRDFMKKLRYYVEENEDCGWTATENPMRTMNRILGDEPLAVSYDLTEWFDMRPVGGSVRKIGIPHNMPVTARGLLRVGAAGSDDDDDLMSIDDNDKE